MSAGRPAPVAPDATRLVLVRHGQTEYNREGRWQGQGTDLPLTATGREQAEAVAGELADRYGPACLAALYTSDLRRALETARILAARLGLEPRVDPALREMDHGLFEGRTKAEILARWPEAYAAFEADPRHVRRPEGDSYGDLAARIWPALERIAARHRGERAVVVSHGGPIRLVLARVLDRPLVERGDFGVTNAAWFVVEESDGEWRKVGE